MNPGKTKCLIVTQTASEAADINAASADHRSVWAMPILGMLCGLAADMIIVMPFRSVSGLLLKRMTDEVEMHLVTRLSGPDARIVRL